MNEKIRSIFFLVTLILFTLLLALTIVSFYFLSQPAPPIISIFVKYHVLFMFIVAIFGLLFGSFSQIYLNKQIQEDKEKKKKTISELLNLLPSEDKKIILYLIKSKGKCTQYELTKLEGMTKLKVHRSIIKLEQKEIISKKRIGKINNIFLNIEI